MTSEHARTQFTVESRNLALSEFSQSDMAEKLACEPRGRFWETLEEARTTLAVTREYEHFMLFMGGNGGQPWQCPLGVPHPSGMFWDARRGELIASSTRTPNQIFFFKQLQEADYQREVVPAHLVRPAGTLFLPYASTLLPGTLYIHDVVMLDDEIYATITGHNFLAKLHRGGGWERVWWPRVLDGLARAAFDQNYLQLNSMAVGPTIADSYFTAFSDETTGPKPWKAGYGPREKGVVFHGGSREVVARKLTCPHSAKLQDGKLWLCNSGYGEVGYVDGVAGGEGKFTPVHETNGFTRGMIFLDDRHVIVGLSKVIDFYEPYAPGLKPAETVCGLIIVDVISGREVGALTWPSGYQIYDIQVMPHVDRPTLPNRKESDGVNHALRYLG